MSIIDKDHPPPLNNFVFSYERGLDPWHEDAFPEEFKYAGSRGKRKEGWFGLDVWGNAIGFIPDRQMKVQNHE